MKYNVSVTIGLRIEDVETKEEALRDFYAFLYDKRTLQQAYVEIEEVEEDVPSMGELMWDAKWWRELEQERLEREGEA